MFAWFKRRRGWPPDEPRPFMHLVPGRRYRVAHPFTDHDGVVHRTGESWTFRRATFLPYEDGLSLFVDPPGGSSRQIRLQHRPEAEGPVIDALDRHLLPLPETDATWPLVVTRDSVCLADDVDAPHLGVLDVPRGAGAAEVAGAVMNSGYAAWVGSRATWSLALGPDRVLFGTRRWRRFVLPVGRAPLAARAEGVERLHVAYHAGADAAELAARMAEDAEALRSGGE